MAKTKESGETLHFAIIMYRNNPFGNGLQCPVEFICNSKARPDLPMLHTVKIHTGQAVSGPQAKEVRPVLKNHVQTTKTLNTLGTHMMYKTPVSMVWYPRIITSILQVSPTLSHFKMGATYRCTRKPYKLTTSCCKPFSAQTRATPLVQNNHKQVSTQTGESLRCSETSKSLSKWICKFV